MGTPRGMHEPTHRSRLSLLVHRFDQAASRAGVALVVGIVTLLIVVGFAGGVLPESWQIGFTTGATAITLIMVFVIQHTQTRHQAATQLKLDELLEAMPDADNRVVKVET